MAGTRSESPIHIFIEPFPGNTQEKQEEKRELWEPGTFNFMPPLLPSATYFNRVIPVPPLRKGKPQKNSPDNSKQEEKEEKVPAQQTAAMQWARLSIASHTNDLNVLQAEVETLQEQVMFQAMASSDKQWRRSDGAVDDEIRAAISAQALQKNRLLNELEQLESAIAVTRNELPDKQSAFLVEFKKIDESVLATKTELAPLYLQESNLALLKKMLADALFKVFYNLESEFKKPDSSSKITKFNEQFSGFAKYSNEQGLQFHDLPFKGFNAANFLDLSLTEIQTHVNTVLRRAASQTMFRSDNLKKFEEGLASLQGNPSCKALFSEEKESFKVDQNKVKEGAFSWAPPALDLETQVSKNASDLRAAEAYREAYPKQLQEKHFPHTEIIKIRKRLEELRGGCNLQLMLQLPTAEEQYNAKTKEQPILVKQIGAYFLYGLNGSQWKAITFFDFDLPDEEQNCLDKLFSESKVPCLIQKQNMDRVLLTILRRGHEIPGPIELYVRQNKQVYQRAMKRHHAVYNTSVRALAEEQEIKQAPQKTFFQSGLQELLTSLDFLCLDYETLEQEASLESGEKADVAAAKTFLQSLRESIFNLQRRHTEFDDECAALHLRDLKARFNAAVATYQLFKKLNQVDVAYFRQLPKHLENKKKTLLAQNKMMYQALDQDQNKARNVEKEEKYAPSRQRAPAIFEQSMSPHDLVPVFRQAVDEIPADADLLSQFCHMITATIRNQDYWHEQLPLSSLRKEGLMPTGIQEMCGIIDDFDGAAVETGLAWTSDPQKVRAFFFKLGEVARQRLDYKSFGFFSPIRNTHLLEFYGYLKTLDLCPINLLTTAKFEAAHSMHAVATTTQALGLEPKPRLNWII